MMRLRKGAETEMRVLDDVAQPVEENGAMQAKATRMMALEGEPDTSPETEPLPPEPVECHVWYDLDGNPCAWSPVDSGVISVEIGQKDDTAPAEVYQALLDSQRAQKTAEQRIAELEQMVARLAAKLAE